MKHLRKPLTLLLALMLAFEIGAPAIMAEEIEPETEAVMESPAEKESSAPLQADFYSVTPEQMEALTNASRSLNVLKPNQKITVTPDTTVGERTYKVHTFMAEKSGLHMVQQFCNGDLAICDENYNYVAHVYSYNGSGDKQVGDCITTLEAGKTYYLVSTGFNKVSYQIKVTDGLRKVSRSNGLEYFLFWQVRAYREYLIPLSSFTFSEALLEMGSNLLNALFLIVVFPFFWWTLFY